MGKKKRRVPGTRKQRRSKSYADCCVLCQLRHQAEEQDAGWSVSDRADELAARMRAVHEWDDSFADVIGAPAHRVHGFMDSWAEPRAPLGESAQVALMAFERFWRSYQTPAQVTT